MHLALSVGFPYATRQHGSTPNGQSPAGKQVHPGIACGRYKPGCRGVDDGDILSIRTIPIWAQEGAVRDTLMRVLRSLISTGAVLAVAAHAALAHEEESAPDPHLAEAVAPGVTGMAVLLAVAVAAGLWGHFRRAAMLRAVRKEIEASAKASAGSTRAPDER